METLGLDELLTPDALVLVEWGEKFKSIRKKATGEIVISSAGGDARKITRDAERIAPTRVLRLRLPRQPPLKMTERLGHGALRRRQARGSLRLKKDSCSVDSCNVQPLHRV